MVRIRRVSLGDAPGYHAALGAVARERKYLRLTDAPSLERSRAFIANNIDKNNPHLVAINEETVVGWCDICRDSDLADHVGSLGIGVLANFRGRGIGKALMKTALEDARTRGFKRIELEVYANNTGAIALYEAFGFEREGLRRSAVIMQNKRVDVVQMGLLWF